MRIGLIGNINNNNFALMRYLRDLGADVHLLLNSNDGRGDLSHFTPEADSWEFEKWKPYVHRTEIPNAVIAALDFPTTMLMGARSWIKYKMGKQKLFVPPVSKAQIRAAYEQYDYLVASGIAPAALTRINRSLDVFYPYGNSVEYLYNADFIHAFSSKGRIAKSVFKKVQKRQAEGIRRTSKTINYEPGITEQALKNIGVNPIRLAIPMVYSGERVPALPTNNTLAEALELINRSSLCLLHHARLMWKNKKKLGSKHWRNENKNSDWLIKSLAEFIKLRPNAKPLLFIVEYGPDVEDTKKLVSQLGISDYVRWLPKMPRKDLMWLLSQVTIGVGEFYEEPKMVWGGTGWETLASAKPLLQGFNFEADEFEEIFGYPPPPMLNVRKQEDVVRHLIDFSDHPEKTREMGNAIKIWFNQYNGLGLAKQWLDLICQLK